MNAELEKTKRTQAERRAETRTSLLESACKLFGERGYEKTSLEDIAEGSGLTIRPIYYHFGNKRGLYRAVNEQMEQRAYQALSRESSVEAWNALLLLCKDPAFRRIIFEDAPNILGRERWVNARKLQWTRSLAAAYHSDPQRRRMSATMADSAAMAALIEAAIYVIERGDGKELETEAAEVVSALLPDDETTRHPESRRELTT